MSEKRVLVIGTTPDYIDHINRRYEGRALFVTDPAVLSSSTYERPDPDSEIICDLSRTDDVLRLLTSHFHKYRQTPSGVVCYDCEWLVLASEVAQSLELPFPSSRSVRLCRNKYLSKVRWYERGVKCPQTELVRNGSDAVAFLKRVGHPIVLKPLTGSGSELTFRCDDAEEATAAMNAVTSGLTDRSESPFYQQDKDADTSLDPRFTVLAEEHVEGCEYSCDFIIDGSEVTVIRVAKKLRRAGRPFGVTLAYQLPAVIPAVADEGEFRQLLFEAATALGLNRAICMVDIMVRGNDLVFLELTPRIGGDCLPPLINQSCGLDMIALAMDFAEGRSLKVPPRSDWQELVGLRLFFRRNGTFRSADTKALLRDARVREVYLKRSPGHRVVLPPRDYDSWLLGHVIFGPDTKSSIERQCKELGTKLTVDMASSYDKKFAGVYIEGGRATQAADTTA